MDVRMNSSSLIARAAWRTTCAMLFMRAEATHVPQNAPLIGDSLVTILLTAVSDAPVSFRSSQSTIGGHAVTAELSGVKTFMRPGIRLTATSQIAVDAELELGSLEETITVTAGTAFVQTTTAQVARTIETRQIQELTLNGRNPIYLASLKPGVRGGTIGTFDPDSVSNGSFSINGSRADEYLVTIDGAVATRTRSSGSMLGAQDIETVEEVQVLTRHYRAE